MVNIFVTSSSPQSAARHQPDLLLPRMALEVAQVLSGAQWNELVGYDNPIHKKPTYKGRPIYRPSLQQRHHPAVQWAGRSRLNYQWALDWGRALIAERYYRDKNASPLKVEAVYDQLEYGIKFIPKGYDEEPVFESFIEKEYRDIIFSFHDNVMHRYRLYLILKWGWLYTRTHKWTRRGTPKFVEDIAYWTYLKNRLGEPNTITYKNYFSKERLL